MSEWDKGYLEDDDKELADLANFVETDLRNEVNSPIHPEEQLKLLGRLALKTKRFFADIGKASSNSPHYL